MNDQTANREVTNTPYKDHSEQYLDRGMAPLPVRPGDRGAQVKGWQKYSENLPSLDRIKEWNEEKGDHGISLVMETELTDAPGYFLVAIDVDDDEFVDPTTELVFGDDRNGDAQYVAKFGSKGITFFAKTLGVIPSKSFDGPNGMGIEVLSSKRQCVIPPSVHHSGNVYEWRSDKTLLEVSLPDLPIVDQGMIDQMADLVKPKNLPDTKPPANDNDTGQSSVAYSGDGHFQGVEMVYPGNVHVTELDMTWKAARWNHQNKSGGPSAREVAIQAIVEHAFDALESSGLGEEWSRDQEVQTISEMYDSALSKFQQASAVGPHHSKAGLLAIVEKVSLWHTSLNEAFASVDVGNHTENMRVDSKTFRLWLRRAFYDQHKEAAPSKAVDEVLDTVEGLALFEGDARETALRVGQQDSAIYIDLGSQDWQAVHISSDGWCLQESPPIAFRRTPGMESLPIPIGGGSIEELRSFVNVNSDDDFMLLVAWLVGCLRPTGPYPILVLNGEQGTGKSTLANILRRLIDPNIAATRTPPERNDEIFIAAENGWMLNFDNLSKVKESMSDAFCRVASGSGYSKRKLYSDSDEVLITVSRPIVINGIPDLATRPDLADRCITIQLPRIAATKRRAESEFWEDFDMEAPRIFGALLDAVVVALRDQSSVTLVEAPRMADFATWVSAAFKICDWEQNQFLGALAKNRVESDITLIESEPCAYAIEKVVVAKFGNWLGSASELLQEIEAE